MAIESRGGKSKRTPQPLDQSIDRPKQQQAAGPFVTTTLSNSSEIALRARRCRVVDAGVPARVGARGSVGEFQSK